MSQGSIIAAHCILPALALLALFWTVEKIGKFTLVTFCLLTLFAQQETINPTNPTAATPAGTTARIVFYQLRNAVAYTIARVTPMYIDEVQVTSLHSKRYASIPIPAGRHNIRSKTKMEAVTINAEATYYVRITEQQSFMHVVFMPTRVEIE